MESLFNDDEPYMGSLRKYEPLIRFDVDGKPQPRKLLKKDFTPHQEQRQPEKDVVDAVVESREPISKPAPNVNSNTKSNLFNSAHPVVAPIAKHAPSDLKRKSDTPANHSEPKKTKQASILSFFNKK